MDSLSPNYDSIKKQMPIARELAMHVYAAAVYRSSCKAYFCTHFPGPPFSKCRLHDDCVIVHKSNVLINYLLMFYVKLLGLAYDYNYFIFLL